MLNFLLFKRNFYFIVVQELAVTLAVTLADTLAVTQLHRYTRRCIFWSLIHKFVFLLRKSNIYGRIVSVTYVTYNGHVFEFDGSNLSKEEKLSVAYTLALWFISLNKFNSNSNNQMM